LRTQDTQAQGIVPFGQADAVGIGHQIAVVVLRDRKLEPLGQQDLTRCRLQQITSPYNLSDCHGCIINHHSKLVRGSAIFSPHQEISEIAAGNKLLAPLAQILK
jgi:hypothetical protein